jgi:hypothetical protein
MAGFQVSIYGRFWVSTEALQVVRPETVVRWHRQSFKRYGLYSRDASERSSKSRASVDCITSTCGGRRKPDRTNKWKAQVTRPLF